MPWTGCSAHLVHVNQVLKRRGKSSATDMWGPRVRWPAFIGQGGVASCTTVLDSFSPSRIGVMLPLLCSLSLERKEERERVRLRRREGERAVGGEQDKAEVQGKAVGDMARHGQARGRCL